MEALEALLKVTLVVFMIGNLLDMGLRLRLSEALRDLADVRFLATSILWGFMLLPGLGYAVTRVVPLSHPHAVSLLLLAMTPVRHSCRRWSSAPGATSATPRR